MKKQGKIIRRGCLIIFLLFLALQLCCATRGMPGGGPQDKTPPQIVDSFPHPDSTGLRTLDEIILYFSERMNESSVEKSIFVSPPLDFETDWSGGDELTLSLKDTLASDQSYVFTIGAGAMDMQKNRMLESYQFAFSTGDHLNRGEIFGRVFKIDPSDVFYIYAYRIIDPDSLDPTRVKADFLSQAGPDGRFWLKYLPYSNFRVFVIEDVNKNLLLDAATERVGIPSRDVSLDSTQAMDGPLNFILTKIDTTPPELSGARATNRRTVVLRASEVIDALTPGAVDIRDTLNMNLLPVKGISRNTKDEKQFFLYTADHDSAKGYRLTVKQMVDTSGNIQPNVQQVDFTGSTLVDTTHFELLSISPRDSASGIDLAAVVAVNFTLPVNTEQVAENFTLQVADSLPVPGDWVWPDLSHGYYRPAENFLPGLTYAYTLKTAAVQSLWGDTLPDTTFKRTFFTIAKDEFGSMSGELVVDKMPAEDVYVDISSVGKKKAALSIRIDTDKKFFVPWILEGLYKIGGFLDINGDGSRSSGQLNPFLFSEPFTIQDDTLRVRKRWELSDLKLILPGI
jgi:hypothetical protein